jgi:iron complex transport system substrate-binding protein
MCLTNNYTKVSAKTPFSFLLLTTMLTSTTMGYPLTITDDFGYILTIPHEPERIVSLAPSNTEILFAMGAGDRVVGVTTYDDYPPEVANISKIGGFSTVNIEAVVNLTPDPDVCHASTL